MTNEVFILVYTVILGLIHLAIAALAARRQEGNLKWAAGPRDEPVVHTGMAGRLERSFTNFKETFVFFAVIIICLALRGRSSELSQIGATVYLVARIFYIPAYAYGWPFRFAIWGVSMFGIIACLIALLI
ncbi:MAPEG family protein [Asticcacaulis machinosus]|uniref:MAPEG family protein n=1 Tax=Asticcacaulis machinosus TaxID=2984211 RepID=A0ABT5HFP2_9CAUL|nr:MAPEG family protein [Asticcacaulis machinosus]MDC7675075.1 MAPEG family protein [Asticcacaulis machinosus]